MLDSMNITLSTDELGTVKNRALLKLIAKKTESSIAAAVQKVKADPVASKLPSVVELLESLAYADSVKNSIKPAQRRSKKKEAAAPAK